MLSDDQREKLFKEEALKLGVQLAPAFQIQKGDLYFAVRNTGVQLLECRSNSRDQGCVWPVGPNYPYYEFECCKIIGG